MKKGRITDDDLLQNIMAIRQELERREKLDRWQMATWGLVYLLLFINLLLQLLGLGIFNR